VVLFSRIIVIRSSYKKVVEMIVHLNDGIIAAMPDDPVGGSYNEQGVSQRRRRRHSVMETQ
jgi:hypothetical protein